MLRKFFLEFLVCNHKTLYITKSPDTSKIKIVYCFDLSWRGWGRGRGGVGKGTSWDNTTDQWGSGPLFKLWLFYARDVCREISLKLIIYHDCHMFLASACTFFHKCVFSACALFPQAPFFCERAFFCKHAFSSKSTRFPQAHIIMSACYPRFLQRYIEFLAFGSMGLLWEGI